MSKFGIIFCGYNTEDIVERALEPFLDDDRFVIAVVSVPFAEYIDQESFEDQTTDILRTYHYRRGKIKYLIEEPRYIKEHEARNLALDCLKKEGIDYLWMADSDEIPTKEDLDKIIEFVENDSESVWWRLSLKNYVFDDKTYLKEPFCPPRIFRYSSKGLYHPSFYWDNDIVYLNSEGQQVSYSQLPNKTIPKEIAWIKHLTWPNNQISKRKCAYQLSHFGQCSFSWNEKDGLTFNEEYFRMNGEKIPEILTDNTKPMEG